MYIYIYTYIYILTIYSLYLGEQPRGRPAAASNAQGGRRALHYLCVCICVYIHIRIYRHIDS